MSVDASNLTTLQILEQYEAIREARESVISSLEGNMMDVEDPMAQICETFMPFAEQPNNVRFIYATGGDFLGDSVLSIKYIYSDLDLLEINMIGKGDCFRRYDSDLDMIVVEFYSLEGNYIVAKLPGEEYSDKEAASRILKRMVLMFYAGHSNSMIHYPRIPTF
jgi:hypothetical protein